MTNPLTANDKRLAELVATKLGSNQLIHPGDGGDHPPTTLQTPFRVVGNPQMKELVDTTLKVMCEAIVHCIKTDGDCNITPKEKPE